MSMPDTQEVSLLVESGWQLIALETFEEDRALEFIEQQPENGSAMSGVE